MSVDGKDPRRFCSKTFDDAGGFDRPRSSVPKSFIKQYKDQAKNADHYREMTEFFSGAEDQDMLLDRSMLYILGSKYERADICLALKAVERDKGWIP